MSERVRGCLYSRFERSGPKPICWYPDNLKSIAQNNLRQVSIKTINMLAADREIPETSAIVPFPKLDMVGLVKFLEIPAPGERGAAKDCSITLLFNEEADDIIHKYFEQFEHEINKCSEIILSMEKDERSEDEIGDILKSFYYAFNSRLDDLIVPEERLEILQRSINEVKNLIQEIIESDSASQDELQTALKLSFELNQLKIDEITPNDIAKIMTIANELQIKKELIEKQQNKLKNISKKMNKKKLAKLENKLSAIVDSFDSYIDQIHKKVEILSDRGTTMLFFRDYKDEAETEHKIAELSKSLTNSINFIRKFYALSPGGLKKASISYRALISSKNRRKKRIASMHAQILSNLVGITKEEILEATKNPQIKAELDNLLGLSKTKKVKKTKKKAKTIKKAKKKAKTIKKSKKKAKTIKKTKKKAKIIKKVKKKAKKKAKTVKKTKKKTKKIKKKK